jgi:uncharacterized protein
MALIFEVKVVPASGKNKWMLDKSGQLKCYLKNQPEKGKANKELISLVAKVLSSPQNHIEIIKGLTTRTKTLKIKTELNYVEFLQILGLESGVQGALF